MIKIEIVEGQEKIDASGNRDDVVIDAGFALHSCISILRECKMSDEFIKGFFRIALEAEGETKDD